MKQKATEDVIGCRARVVATFRRRVIFVHMKMAELTPSLIKDSSELNTEPFKKKEMYGE